MKLTCTTCGQAIPSDDFNIATDIAYCRACDATHSIASLRKLSNVNAKDFEKFVLSHVSRDNPDQIRVAPQRWGLLFLLPFATIWSGGSVGPMYILPIMNGVFPPLPMLLFGIPFLLGSIALWSIVLYLLIGKVALTVDRGIFSYQVLIGPFSVRRKEIPVTSASTVSVETSIYQSETQRYRELRIEGEEGSLTCGAKTLRNEYLDNLCLWIQMKLSGLK